jgi:hypothetical protein
MLVAVLVLRYREDQRWQTVNGLDAELALVRSWCLLVAWLVAQGLAAGG